MTDLAEAIDSLKNAVAIPGTFATTFPSTSDDDLTLVLVDAFGEAQLNGFFSAYTATAEGVVAPDISRAEIALIVLYATVRILRTELRNRKTHVRYEAGTTVFEQDQSAQLLVGLLKAYEEEKKAVTTVGVARGAASAFYMADQYLERAGAFGTFNVAEPHYVGWN